MKKYNYECVDNYIMDNAQSIVSVSLGMREDWSFTSMQVYERGEYKVVFDENTTICGIDGSGWATPVMLVTYTDGSKYFIPCWRRG